MEIQEIPNELLRTAAQGDIDACEEIYKAASGFVYNVALRVTTNPDDAMEATQEAFIRIFKSLGEFKFRSSFKTWVYRIAVNTALNARKKETNFRSRHAELDENMAAGDDPVKANVEKNGNEETVSRLLKALNPDQRACVVLREMQGMDYAEIARTLNININTVRSRLKRAREIMMKQRDEVIV